MDAKVKDSVTPTQEFSRLADMPLIGFSLKLAVNNR